MFGPVARQDPCARRAPCPARTRVPPPPSRLTSGHPASVCVGRIWGRRKRWGGQDHGRRSAVFGFRRLGPRAGQGSRRSKPKTPIEEEGGGRPKKSQSAETQIGGFQSRRLSSWTIGACLRIETIARPCPVFEWRPLAPPWSGEIARCSEILFQHWRALFFFTSPLFYISPFHGSTELVYFYHGPRIRCLLELNRFRAGTLGGWSVCGRYALFTLVRIEINS